MNDHRIPLFLFGASRPLDDDSDAGRVGPGRAGDDGDDADSVGCDRSKASGASGGSTAKSEVAKEEPPIINAGGPQSCTAARQAKHTRAKNAGAGGESVSSQKCEAAAGVRGQRQLSVSSRTAPLCAKTVQVEAGQSTHGRASSATAGWKSSSPQTGAAAGDVREEHQPSVLNRAARLRANTVDAMAGMKEEDVNGSQPIAAGGLGAGVAHPEAPVEVLGPEADSEESATAVIYSKIQEDVLTDVKAIKKRIVDVCLLLRPPHRVTVNSNNSGRLSGLRSGEAYYGFTLACSRAPRYCEGCTWSAGCKFYTTGAQSQRLRIESSGTHGQCHQSLDGGQVWTAEALQAIRAMPEDQALSTGNIRKASKRHGVNQQTDDCQLHDWVKRERAKARTELPIGPDQPIGVVEHRVREWKGCQSSYADAALDELLVLETSSAPRGYVVREDLVYIPFASKGMLEMSANAKGKLLKVVVDGKHRILNNGYPVLSFAWVVGSQTRSWTKVNTHGHGQGTRLELHTSTCKPFFKHWLTASRRQS